MDVKECPWCGISIVIEAENCRIFRCGVMKDTYTQIDPHLSKELCEAIKDKIYGCANPFKLIDGVLQKCGYE